MTFGSLLFTACANQHPNHLQTTTPNHNKPKIALVLGGGGTHGYAHIGAIKALEENGIRPDLIVGTSAGAIVGAIYASGKSPTELEHIAKNLNEIDLLDIAPSQLGLIKGNALNAFVNRQVNHQPIERLPIRFVAIGTDAQTKTTTSFRQGDTGLAVQASSSVPTLFIAPRIPAVGGKRYIDGGQSALLPASIAKSMGASFVISIDVMSSPIQPSPPNTAQTLSIRRTDTGISAIFGDGMIELPINAKAIKQNTKNLPIDIDKILSVMPKNTQFSLPKDIHHLPKNKDDMIRLINAIFVQNQHQPNPDDIKASDILIAPNLSQYAVFDGTHKTKIIQAGYDATIAKIPKIKQALASQLPKN